MIAVGGWRTGAFGRWTTIRRVWVEGLLRAEMLRSEDGTYAVHWVDPGQHVEGELLYCPSEGSYTRALRAYLLLGGLDT